MQNEKFLSRDAFVAVLKHYGIFEDQELYKIVCPFHGDLNPSLQINLNKAYFYCYGCGIHGGTVELVKAFEKGISTFEAYRKVAEIVKGIKGPKLSTASAEPSIKSKASFKEGIRLARDFYYNLPKTNWFKPDEDAFQIKRYMNGRGFTTSTLKKAQAKATYNKLYPIVFPMFDNGIFRGYVMRTDDPQVEGERKYLYNKGFKRRITLPGDYKYHTVVLVEGFLDKLKANQIGIKYVVAVLGWKLTSEQLEKLKKAGVKTIICALDNDEKGNQGYKYLKRICSVNKLGLHHLRYPKSMKDMGDVSPKTAGQILRQIHRFGGK